MENLIKLVKEIIDDYKYSALTYIQTVLDEYRAMKTIELDEVDYDPKTGDLKSTYIAKGHYIVLAERGQAFRFKVFEGKRQIFMEEVR